MNGGPLVRWGGYQIQVSTMITKVVRFSRSPGRSARRARMGHRQHAIEVPGDPLMTGNTIIMHPDTFERMKQVIASSEHRSLLSRAGPVTGNDFR